MITMSEGTGYYFEVYRDVKDRYQWRFWAPSGRLMAESAESYESRQACLCAINCLRTATKSGLAVISAPGI
jgi:uncharacterized protein YegP (UPF0339 family)